MSGDRTNGTLGGRYELGELLGHGGMADVRKAHDLRLGRTVAVKMLRTDLARDATFQARFRREAQSAASLNAPRSSRSTTPVRTSSTASASPTSSWSTSRARPCASCCAQGQRLMPNRALEITAGVLGALEYSHQQGIIHRDIKPANVMLATNGDVKVMDFGIARAVADSGATMTQTANVLGTAQYLSPEQARGETVDARSDVYSTGCLLYELLTGRPPVPGRVTRRGRLPARAREPGAAVDAQPRHRRRGRRDRHEGADQEPRQPLPVGGGDARRHRAGAAGRHRCRRRRCMAEPPTQPLTAVTEPEPEEKSRKGGYVALIIGVDPRARAAWRRRLGTARR